MFLSHRVWKLLFHTPTKRQTGYSWFVIPISTIPVTKHPLFLKISLSLLPNALLCSLLPNLLLLLSQICPHEASSPRSVLMKPWISLPQRFFLYWSLKDLGFESVDLRSDLGFKIQVLYWSLTFERFGVWKCWFEIWFRFKYLGFIWVWEYVWSWGLIVFVRVWMILLGLGNNKSWRFCWV